MLNRMRNLYRRYRRDKAIQRPYCFIHINKCGGTSVEAALGLPLIHDTAQQRRARIGAERWARIKSFSVVRHPVSKVTSHYRYRVETNKTGMAHDPIGLNEWIKRSYGDRDPAYYNQPLMFAPCRDWLVDEDGALMVDLVIKLEQITTDWARVEELLGLKADLPRANTTRKSKDRSGEALDPESLAIIEDRFRVDFEMFDYDIANVRG